MCKRRKFSRVLIEGIIDKLRTNKGITKVEIFLIYDWNFKGARVLFSYDEDILCPYDVVLVRRNRGMSKKTIAANIEGALEIFEIVRTNLTGIPQVPVEFIQENK